MMYRGAAPSNRHTDSIHMLTLQIIMFSQKTHIRWGHFSMLHTHSILRVLLALSEQTFKIITYLLKKNYPRNKSSQSLPEQGVILVPHKPNI